MTIEEIKAIKDFVASFGIGALVAVISITVFVRAYLLSYLSEKAKNLATKEDVRAITDEIEAVKHGYTSLIETQRATQQLRLAAIDKRLEIHQEAFARWRDLFSAIYESKIDEVAGECNQWWGENCLYLEPDVRQAFIDAVIYAKEHKSLVESRAGIQAIESSMAKIRAFPDTLFNAIQLPILNDDEKKATFKA